jgi:iron complex outermembrane receptor protein
MKRFLWPLALVALPVAADELDRVTVEEAQLPINANVASPAQYNQLRGFSGDGGEFLNQINGVSTSRFGGRGLEPVIRGQAQTQINVLLDGAYLHGGCPNRMDPPSSWAAALETYEEVKVLKGVQSVVYGGGGSGGTVLFERDSRRLAAEGGNQGRVVAGGSDNGIQHDVLADGLLASEQGHWRVMGEKKKMENYQDGAGDEVRSAFDHQQGGMIVGWTPTASRLLELSFERNQFNDTLYAGNMDSPEESGNIARIKFADKLDGPWLTGLQFETYLSDIDHVMDNYRLRPPPRYATGEAMLREARTQSKTVGGRLQLQAEGELQWLYGMDMQNNQRDAALTNNDTGTARAISLVWPKAAVKQTGLFAQATQHENNQQITYGLRADYVQTDADKVQVKPEAGMKTAAQMYQMYYGTTATSHDHWQWGGLLRYERQINDWTWATGLSRSVRTPDATELYINKWGMPANTRWIGNPALAAEKHHQWDVSFGQNRPAFNWQTVLFYDKVSDFILRDGARGQTGVLLSDNADIYRNVSADLYGAEWQGQWQLHPRWQLGGSLAYVHGDNDSDDRPLAQMPPLNGQLQLDYQPSRWGMGARLRFAQRQMRINGLSKQEVGTTAGYGVLDLYGHYPLNAWLNLRLGVDNVLNKTYAQHLNRANLMDNQSFKVNEAGRTAWLKLNAEF